ncbi:glycolipid 2-alpha-mannosyltransferase-domain-containing protein, partial [Mycena rosella]
ANATFVILARNSDLDSTVRSVREVEDSFNTRHHYPYSLLNDEPFTDEFKRRVSAVASGPVAYGLVPREHWVQPDWIDEERATKGRAQLVADNVIYGGSCRYRNMCRYNSGFFFRHPLVEQYRWYWRIEPRVRRCSPSSHRALTPHTRTQTSSSFTPSTSPATTAATRTCHCESFFASPLHATCSTSPPASRAYRYVYASDAPHRMPHAQGGPRMRGRRALACCPRTPTSPLISKRHSRENRLSCSPPASAPNER